jgi:cytochrome b involved in lipid metabolism
MNSTRAITFRRIAAAVVVPMAMATVLVAPAAQAAPSSAVSAMPSKSYSLAQVKKHRTAANCWSVVNGNVYNLTSWVKKHPGGQSPIIAMCGKNATASFNGKHKSSATARKALATYRIGTLR